MGFAGSGTLATEEALSHSRMGRASKGHAETKDAVKRLAALGGVDECVRPYIFYVGTFRIR